MEISVLAEEFVVCKLNDIHNFDSSKSIFFLAKTDQEISLVCKKEDAPDTLVKEEGWKALRIEGVLDFSLVGILARIATILADNQISIFAVSTYNTDYILVKKACLNNAIEVLVKHDYKVKELN